MKPLDKPIRNRLERTIKDARDIAEGAARASLEQLGVGEAAPFAHLSNQERELRRKLRVHGRQLGDSLNGRKIQTMDRLMEEVAYEHWHRMLFARFLAENDLLMYPDPDDPVAVSLEECEDLAADEGEKNGWELASRFAARMLPEIFRPDSPVFQLALPPEHQQKLELLLSELPREVFQASDALGWVYQFWQAKKKDEVNASEVKIGARELPIVTQLFTESYMVAFLLDNSLGAWWAARRLTEADLRNAKNEAELRRKASLPGMPLDYLRFVKQENGAWAPAAGAFNGWPEKLDEFKMLDPCCGSGHFLVVAFLMLVAMRMADERMSVQGAAEEVLRDNLYGLEIDRRCTEIAAFNLALTAWRLAGYRQLPAPHIACTGISVGSSREQWMDILAGQPIVSNLRFYFGQLYDLFSKAPTLGSLINPHRFLGSGLLDEKGMANLHRALTAALAGEAKTVTERSEMGVTAQGVAKAAELLTGRFTLVATNVPYLGRGKQDEVLKGHLETHYPLGKADLATAFVLRCLEFCAKGGTTVLVTPQNWLFLTTYTKLRQMLLENRSWNVVARLGPGAFETISGHVVNVALPMITANIPDDAHTMAGIDVSATKEPEEKAAMLRKAKSAEIVLVLQDEQLKNPDARVTVEKRSNLPLLSSFAKCLVGIQTGDDPYYIVGFWEVEWGGSKLWEPMQATPDEFSEFAGQSWMIRWASGKGDLHLAKGARIQGIEAVGKNGVAMHRMGRLFPYYYLGNFYHQNVAVIVPRESIHLPAIWCFCSSPDYEKAVRKIDQKLNVTNATLVKIPFDIANWQKIAAEKYPNGLPEPESDDPTQWLFHGRPEHSTAPLQVAVARLLGFRWPAELDEKMRLSQRARELVQRCDELFSFADKDGIICIPPVRGEASAADRLLNMLVKAYGKEWHTDVLSALLKDAGFAGKHLETWLREGFFAQHCDLFHQRPFIWQIWDGLRGGFSALVNYHKLDRKNLETLIFTYLGDWISRQKNDIASGVDGAQERLQAADALKKRLELILEGESPYDIFVRWKPLRKQPIGWEPDLNDGVRLNIRPFLSVPDIKTKGAGVLRVTPKIKWTKDRGKEPKRPIREYPWFWGWDGKVDFEGGSEFTGERFNDCHYTLDIKRRARQSTDETEGVFS
ncbi:MAG: restriction endonuclease subunit M [Desulfatitalea sp. BRH_c12]|nr:MAG: restriction endonuclease subunit M [Desulfatitalea sp. BRH_c12]